MVLITIWRMIIGDVVKWLMVFIFLWMACTDPIPETRQVFTQDDVAVEDSPGICLAGNCDRHGTGAEGRGLELEEARSRLR
jgi:hypothetical protein